MTHAQTLARLAKPDVHPRTYLRALYTAISLSVVVGKCCGNWRCELAKSGELMAWLERTAWTQAGEA